MGFVLRLAQLLRDTAKVLLLSIDRPEQLR